MVIYEKVRKDKSKLYFLSYAFILEGTNNLNSIFRYKKPKWAVGELQV